MKEQFIPYEQALQLKELGFNESCLAFWVTTYKLQFCFNHNSAEGMKLDVSAPLWQQAFDWFRITYDLHSVLRPFNKGEMYFFTIISPNAIDYTSGSKSMSYEDARLECLEELINLVKQ